MVLDCRLHLGVRYYRDITSLFVLTYDTDKLIECCSTPNFTPVSVSHYYSTIVKDKRTDKRGEVSARAVAVAVAEPMTATFKKINKVVYTS